MRKIFFHLCILSFFSHTTVQSNERSKALSAIQSKIDSLNAQILSLRNKGRTSPPTKLSTKQLLYKKGLPIFPNKQVINKSDNYQVLEEVDSLNSKFDSFNEEIIANSTQGNTQLSEPAQYLDEVIQPPYHPETNNGNRESKLATGSKEKHNYLKENENLTKRTVEEESQKEFLADDHSKRNSFSFYYGFTIPNKSNFRKYGIQFHEGQQLSIEYLRKFDSFFLGTTFATKVYENKKITGIRVDDTIKGRSADYIHLVETGQINAFGQNRLFALSINGGWKPILTDRIFMKNKISMGMAFSDRELKIEEQMLTQSDMVLYYSFLSGLGIQWNDFFHTLFYYQFDGQSETERFDDQTFHELGISFGIDY